MAGEDFIILDLLKELRTKLDFSLEQGQSNGEGIKMLRNELGMDKPYGRIPGLETTVARLEIRVDNLETRLKIIEVAENLLTGQRRVMSLVWSFLSGSAGATLVAYMAHVFGFIK